MYNESSLLLLNNAWAPSVPEQDGQENHQWVGHFRKKMERVLVEEAGQESNNLV